MHLLHAKDPTLPTLEYILQKVAIAFFALMWSRDITLFHVLTIVAFSEVCNNLVDLLLFDHASSTSDDLVDKNRTHKFPFSIPAYSPRLSRLYMLSPCRWLLQLGFHL